MTGLRKVETARAEDKQKTQAVQIKTKRLGQLVADGKAAFAAKQYAKSIDAYRSAKKLDPDNVEVLAGLTQAEQAQEKLGAEARRKAEDAERQQSVARLLKSGQENLKAKQYDAAAVAFQEALKLSPGDKSAQAALAAAQEGRKQAAAGAKAEAEAKQRTEAYQKLLADGQIALRGKRYEDAIKAFAEAQKVLPGDRTSAQLLKDAQQAKADGEAALAAAAKKRAQELERAANVQKAKDYLAAAQGALRKKDFDGATKALALANKLDPDSPAVDQALRELAQARKTAIDQQERQAQAEAAVQAGRKALAAKQYAEAIRTLQLALRPEAIKALQEAARLAPNDPEPARLLKQAQKGLTETPKETPKGVVKETPKDTKAGETKAGDLKRFNQLMQTGQKALDDKKYDDAVKAFRAAVLIMPNDQQAARLLKQAEKLQDKKKK
jgi:tetratricopeptide (TPR) repeat protein